MYNFAEKLNKQLKAWVNESPSTRNINLIWYLIRQNGLKKILSSYYYDNIFYEEHLGLKSGYEKFAEIIFDQIDFKSVCDFGCGNGLLLKYLFDRGIQEIRGVDGSPFILNFVAPAIRDNISILDLKDDQDLGSYDLVISTEVAEHIPKTKSGAFVRNISRSALKIIIFTAAHPGQWGDGHINCQPRSFWIKLFEKEGWVYNEPKTKVFIDLLKSKQEIKATIPWIIDNIMLFDKP
ncbi:class I SAM-dependent methyltransferase [Brasilonema sp. CT11]|nr:class I SAM-dependent methyltransferase [Brasilonema sp. CT11]